MLFHTHTIYLGQGADGEGRPGLGDALARALTYAPRASPAGTYMGLWVASAAKLNVMSVA